MSGDNPVGLALPEDAIHGPNCGVTAVAVAAGVPFATAWDTIKALGGYGNRWQGVTNWRQQMDALVRLGVRLGPEVLHRRYVLRRRRMAWVSTMTLRQWAALHTRKGQRYLVNVTGHALVYCDGYLIDQNGARPLALSRFSRSWMYHSIEINP